MPFDYDKFCFSSLCNTNNNLYEVSMIILVKRLDSLLGYAKTGIYNNSLKINVYNYLLSKSPKPGWWEYRSLGRGVTKDWSRILRGLGWVIWGCRLGRKMSPPPKQRWLGDCTEQDLMEPEFCEIWGWRDRKLR